MSQKTHLDELIDYSSNIISSMANSQEIVALMLDKDPANVDLGGDDGDIAREHMFDYDYVDDTQLEAGAYIMVDVDMIDSPTGTVKDMEVYVQIVVSKTYMELDKKSFKGVKGNRRDNLARQIDLLLNGSKDFGIGKLSLMSARTANVPKSFTSKMLTYGVSDFAYTRGAGRR